MVSKIYLQKIGEVNESILLTLKKNLDWFYKWLNLKTKILDEVISLTPTEYNPTKRQYNASKIMKRLIKNYVKEHHYPFLGVLEEDIYTKMDDKELDYIFGLGHFPFEKPNHAGLALISTARLKESFYLHKEDPKLFELRVFKEAIHELGHAFGLEHCEDYCVMERSKRIEHTDNKPAKYCELCSLKVEEFLEGLRRNPRE